MQCRRGGAWTSPLKRTRYTHRRRYVDINDTTTRSRPTRPYPGPICSRSRALARYPSSFLPHLRIPTREARMPRVDNRQCALQMISRSAVRPLALSPRGTPSNRYRPRSSFLPAGCFVPQPAVCGTSADVPVARRFAPWMPHASVQSHRPINGSLVVIPNSDSAWASVVRGSSPDASMTGRRPAFYPPASTLLPSTAHSLSGVPRMPSRGPVLSLAVDACVAF
ncbi:hypothetical protein C8Q80DRAFT_108012 [Daedaleopsis nitida]|nr:hypothetical protein C8Q80DRAFT_108012 [Daedaleopsis nitida]